MCDCIAKINGGFFSADRNTRIKTVPYKHGEDAPREHRVQIVTLKVDGKRARGPETLLATFCPFCGVPLLAGESKH